MVYVFNESQKSLGLGVLRFPRLWNPQGSTTWKLPCDLFICTQVTELCPSLREKKKQFRPQQLIFFVLSLDFGRLQEEPVSWPRTALEGFFTQELTLPGAARDPSWALWEQPFCMTWQSRHVAVESAHASSLPGAPPLNNTNLCNSCSEACEKVPNDFSELWIES